MHKSFRAGRLGAKYYWRIGSQHRVPCLQKRHYADRYTFDDLTQSRIDAIYKAPGNASLQNENPWRTNYPEDLNDIGYESHCNDRLYTAKNNFRHSLQEYGLKRMERRLESQERFKKHFNSDAALGNKEMRKVSVIQDMSKHKKRQGDIIEMNRRLWQSRPQVKREINLSGITYRPDEHKHLTANEHHRDFSRYPDKSEAETNPEAEESVFQRRMKRLIGRYPEAERADSRTSSRRPEAEEAEEAEKDFRFGGQSQSSALQSRLKELMEAESKPEAEEDEWRMKSRRPEAEDDERQMKSPRAEAEEDEWRMKSRRPEAEEDEWRMKSPRAEAEDWRMKSRRPEAEEDEWRMKSPRAEAEVNEWRMKSRRPEAEEDEWRMKSPRAEAEVEDWRMKSRRPEAEEDEWRMKSPRAEAEDNKWRIKSRRPEAEEDEWRMKSPRAEAEVNEWRMKSLSSKNLQKRLMELMEAETKPEAEEAEEAERTQSPKAEAERRPRSEAEGSPRSEAERSPRSEAEKQKEAEDKAWKSRNLSLVYDPNRPSMDSPKKREQQVESQYWHSWHTCPGSQEAETTVKLKPHPRRRRIAIRPPPYTRDGQRRSYHQIALYPQPIEVQPEPLANAPLMPKPLRVIPKKEKKSKPKRKRERRSVEPPRFKMTIRCRPLVARRPTPMPSYLRRLNLLSEVAGPSFHMANLHETPLNANYAG